MKLVTGTQMKALDRQAIEDYGIPSLELMENAGRQIVASMMACDKTLTEKRVVIVCGKGNNGGDGMVVARLLKAKGVSVQVFLLAEVENCSEETQHQLQLLQQHSISVKHLPDEKEFPELKSSLDKADVVVDALLGVGIKGAVRGHYAIAIRMLNQSDAKCMAVDVPSGVDADMGHVEGEAVQAAFTVTLGLPKIGLLLYPGRSYVGKLKVASIGYPDKLVEGFDSPYTFLDQDHITEKLPPRPDYSHKGSFGRALLFAGSKTMTGAAILSGKAALRSGIGLLFILSNLYEPLRFIISTQVFEALDDIAPPGTMPSKYEDLSEMDAVALGPGLSQGFFIQGKIRKWVSKMDTPLIIDADGINALVGHLQLLEQRKSGTVLTPHPGEFSRLTGLSIQEIETNRFEVAQEFAKAHHVILVLKGVPTVIATPEGQVFVNSTGNSGLAKGGSGDVLTGMMLALAGQGASLLDAACCAVWVHGFTADYLRDHEGMSERGMLPSDLIEALPRVWRLLEIEEAESSS